MQAFYLNLLNYRVTMSCSYSKDFSSTSFTNVENVFINEYLPSASGDYVRVYLYGLFLCQNPTVDKSLKDIADCLSLSEETVLQAFVYWEDFGAVNILSKEPLNVTYNPLRVNNGGKVRKIKPEKYADFSKGLQALFPDKMISTNEYTEYFHIMESYSMKPEAMLMVAKYCVDLKGGSIGYKYVLKVAKDFANRGLTTLDQVELELSSFVTKTKELESILKAMSIKRASDHEDAKLLKKWTGELDFEFESILFAAKKLKRGNMEKLDAFLLELYQAKCFSPTEISIFIDKKQAIWDTTEKIVKALGLYFYDVQPVIDNYVNKWISYGFESDALLFIATECFKLGKNNLRDMDDMVENFRNRGVIALSSICDYFENQKKQDEFIKKFLLTVGVNRRPNAWDRENIEVWKNWNFTEEMILEAGKLAAGKSSPIPYVNGILSNWKNNGIFSTGALNEVSVSANDNSQEKYNREYERRRSLAHSRAQKNCEKAMSLEGFSHIFGRLNSIEKDLAFAELSGNLESLNNLEKEKVELTQKATDILKTANLTLRDLSPVYACEKCNDTGYVGTHRCDCYDKQVN